ncbi:LicD family protein [Candidatus Pelagibacter sp.]|nr:LicD family protein [Candidatus Pelagibacter sp.]
MDKNKIRIRSKYELEIRKKEFLESCKILEKLKINYFLVSGILLGAVRDKKLISWDWDIELSLFSDVLEKKLSIIENELIKKKFTIIKINRKKNQLKIDYFGKLDQTVTCYSIESWSYSKKRKVFWRNSYQIPEKFLKKFSKVKLFGKYFNCPKNPEKFLEFLYGDWKKPLRTFNKNEYISKGFINRKRLYLDKTIMIIKKIAYKIINIHKFLLK